MIEPSVNVQLPTGGLTRIYPRSFTTRSDFGTQARADSVLVAVLNSSYGIVSIEDWFYGALIVPNGRTRLATPGCTMCFRYSLGAGRCRMDAAQGHELPP